MGDGLHFVGLDVQALRFVGTHRIVVPTALPEFVGEREKVVGLVVAAVVGAQAIQPQAACAAVHVAGHDVPADPPPCELIERAHVACKGVGVVGTHRGGEAKAQVLRHRGHGGDQQPRVVHR